MVMLFPKAPADSCCGGDAKTLVLACSGGSNVGQIANNIMIELNRRNVGNAGCLAGIGAALSGFVDSAKAAKTIVIDGCPTGCGKKTVEKYGILPSQHIVITELGIEKTHDFSSLDGETEAALGAIISLI
jgi:uncharacterized metal-binding protein